MELVTVHRTFVPAEAQLIRSRLDAAGILVTIKNELDGYSLYTRGVLVQVPAERVAEAQALLAEMESPTGESEGHA